MTLKSGILISLALYFIKIALAIQGPLLFHTNFSITRNHSVKTAVGNLTSIALNL